MIRPADDFLANSKSPRLASLPPNRENEIIEAAREANYAVWLLDGRRMHDDASIFDQFAVSMRFPDYFGRNWDALDECLRDMGWAPAKGHLIIVDDADALFLRSPRSFRSLTDSLRFASEHWDEWQEQRVPFKSIFVTKSREIAALMDLAL